MEQDKAKAYLLLEDGTLLEGSPMGTRGKAIGLVAFHTGMVGYQQLLTDPANRGILLIQTFPSVGNYGVNEADAESDRVQAAGYIVREICDTPSNYRCEGTLPELLNKNNTVGICGIDTRYLTKQIREKGEMRGVILSDGALNREALLEELKAWKPDNLLSQTTAFASVCEADEPICRIGVLDLGATRSLYRTLQCNGMDAVPLSCGLTADELKQQYAEAKFDGILLSDGPGDPSAYSGIVETVRELLQAGIPMLGISLGHQLLARAHGLRTQTLSCGHRGANQPVLNLQTGRTYITSQNHGCVVEDSPSLADVGEVRYINANDKTIEGIVYQDGISAGVQFLPDGKPGIQSTVFIYDEFCRMVLAKKGQVK